MLTLIDSISIDPSLLQRICAINRRIILTLWIFQFEIVWLLLLNCNILKNVQMENIWKINMQHIWLRLSYLEKNILVTLTCATKSHKAHLPFSCHWQNAATPKIHWPLIHKCERFKQTHTHISTLCHFRIKSLREVNRRAHACKQTAEEEEDEIHDKNNITW